MQGRGGHSGHRGAALTKPKLPPTSGLDQAQVAAEAAVATAGGAAAKPNAGAKRALGRSPWSTCSLATELGSGTGCAPRLHEGGQHGLGQYMRKHRFVKFFLTHVGGQLRRGGKCEECKGDASSSPLRGAWRAPGGVAWLPLSKRLADACCCWPNIPDHPEPALFQGYVRVVDHECQARCGRGRAPPFERRKVASLARETQRQGIPVAESRAHQRKGLGLRRGHGKRSRARLGSGLAAGSGKDQKGKTRSATNSPTHGCA